MPAEWRTIPSFPNYEVSENGLVRRKAYEMVQQFKGGYARVGLTAGDGQTERTVHSLVAEAFRGPRPTGLEIRHLDGDRENNSPTNLKYGTRLENSMDKVRHGTMAGGLNGRAKMNEDTVLRARDMRTFGSKITHIAKWLNVSEDSLGKLFRGETWSHI